MKIKNASERENLTDQRLDPTECPLHLADSDYSLLLGFINPGRSKTFASHHTVATQLQLYESRRKTLAAPA